jgi:hypothetical protein
MKRFNRKKLIPSLAASVMVAVATLAPLPSFLTSGNVYATPVAKFDSSASSTAHHLPTVHATLPPRAISTSPATLNADGTVTVTVRYGCPRLSRATIINLKLVQNPNRANTGSSTSTTPLTCDNRLHLANVIVTSNTGSFVVGKASTTTKLENAFGHAVSEPYSRAISIQ